MILQTIHISTGKESLSILGKNQNILSDTSSSSVSIGIGENIKNLSIIIKLTKSKKPNLIKCKISDVKKKNNKVDFVKTSSFGMDFLTFRAIEAFISS